MAKSCSVVTVTRSRAAMATVPRQQRHSRSIHMAPRCAASRLVTTAGLTISAIDWLKPEIECARPRILSSARLLISGFLVGATMVSPTAKRLTKANKITIRQPGPSTTAGNPERREGPREDNADGGGGGAARVRAEEPQYQQLDGHDDCGVDGEGPRDRVVRDVGRQRRKRRKPGIERPRAGASEQQGGQNHQTEPAVAEDVAVPDPGFIYYPCSPQVRQREQQDREKKTREAVGKEEHLEGPGMIITDDE